MPFGVRIKKLYATEYFLPFLVHVETPDRCKILPLYDATDVVWTKNGRLAVRQPVYGGAKHAGAR